MEKTVVWKPMEYEGIEHLHIRQQGDQVHVESVVVGVQDGGALRLDYRMWCSRDFAVRELSLTLDGRELWLSTNGSGRWFDTDGQSLPEFDGCLDVDIVATPFTNTLPIRRIQWQVGQSETFKMVYILVPELTVSIAPQRYTCLEKSARGGLFRFESLDSGFTALLRVDTDGLVVDYPGLFKRVLPVTG